MSLPDPLRMSVPDWGRTLGLGRAAAYAAVHRLGLPVPTDGLVDVKDATSAYFENTQVRVTNKPGVDVRVVYVEALARAASKSLRAGACDAQSERALREAIGALPDDLYDEIVMDFTVWDLLCVSLFEPGTTTPKPEHRAR